MILTSNAVAPDGRRLFRGQHLPDDVGEEFTHDIAAILVANDAHPLLRINVDSEEEFIAAWRRIHEHDVDSDPLVIVAADRIRHLATEAGLYRLATLRPFVDEMPPPDEEETPADAEPVPTVDLTGTSSRGRKAKS